MYSTKTNLNSLLEESVSLLSVFILLFYYFINRVNRLLQRIAIKLVKLHHQYTQQESFVQCVVFKVITSVYVVE